MIYYDLEMIPDDVICDILRHLTMDEVVMLVRYRLVSIVNNIIPILCNRYSLPYTTQFNRMVLEYDLKYNTPRSAYNDSVSPRNIKNIPSMVGTYAYLGMKNMMLKYLTPHNLKYAVQGAIIPGNNDGILSLLSDWSTWNNARYHFRDAIGYTDRHDILNILGDNQPISADVCFSHMLCGTYASLSIYLGDTFPWLIDNYPQPRQLLDHAILCKNDDAVQYITPLPIKSINIIRDGPVPCLDINILRRMIPLLR